MAELNSLDINEQNLPPACGQIVPSLDAYHDNELKDDERKSVEEHLSNCQACSERLSGIKQVVAAVQSMPKASMKRDMTNELDDILTRSSNVVWFKRPMVAGSIAAAAAIAALALAPMLLPGIAPANVANKPLEVAPISPAKNDQTQSPIVETATNKPEGSSSDNQEKQIANNATKQPEAQNSSSKDKKVETQSPVIAQKPKTTTIVENNASATASSEVIAKKDTTQPPTPQASNTNTTDTSKNAANCDEGKVIAYFGDIDQNAMDVGISTDEDGLYAIKL